MVIVIHVIYLNFLYRHIHTNTKNTFVFDAVRLYWCQLRWTVDVTAWVAHHATRRDRVAGMGRSCFEKPHDLPWGQAWFLEIFSGAASELSSSG